MSDVPGHDRVDAELAAFRTATPPPLAPAGAVRARGEQRRRHTMAATAGAATLSMVAIAAVALAMGGRGPVNPPVTTQSPTPSAAPSVSASPTPSATTSPSPTASAQTRPTPSAAGYPLLTEALVDPADLPFGPWKQDASGRDLRETPLDPCGDTAYPAEARRERGVWRTLRPVEPNGDYVVEGGGVTHDVHAYWTAAEAAEAEQGYRRAVAACRTHTEEAPDGSRYQVTYTVIQQEPLLVERTYSGAPGEPLGMYPDYVGMARYDDVVTLVEMSFGEGPNRDGARRVLAAAARETCDARRAEGQCS